MKNYKVFYNDVEIANFDVLKDATNYIYDMLKKDDLLDIQLFNIYIKLD